MPSTNLAPTENKAIASDYEKAITELATELAYNYYSNSFGDEFNIYGSSEDNKNKINSKSRDIFENEKLADDFAGRFASRFISESKDSGKVRNILIVGAGASYDSYKALPTGEMLIDEVKADYETEIKTINFLAKKFEEEADAIIDITGKPKLTFENYLYLLSKFFVSQKDLREKIKDMTGFRYSISLFNELIAHMLKHAFLDVVINFNFEETLDQSIEEEIGPLNYHNIIHDGNCVPLEQILVDGRLKIPIYIKPHGTFSHKSTLRFTNKHYFDLPTDIKIMLEGIFSGVCGNKKEIQRVNLICVGFKMESLEFNKILNAKLPADSVIYHIDWQTANDDEKNNTIEDFFKDRKLDGFLNRAKGRGREPKKVYRGISTKKFSQNEPKIENNYKAEIDSTKETNHLTSTFGQLFSEIWRKQHGFFNTAYKPRSISRHEILSYFFYEPALGLQCLRDKDFPLLKVKEERKYIRENYEMHPKNFLNRIMVELAIILNRNNGMIDIAEILKDKIGYYYSKYEEACNLFPNKIKRKYSLFEIVNEFSLGGENSPDFWDGYRQGKNVFLLKTKFDAEELEKDGQNIIKEVSKKLKEEFSNITIPYTKVSWNDLSSAIDKFESLFSEKMLAWYNYLHENKTGKTEKSKKRGFLKMTRIITIFYALLTSKKLSNLFKVNFLLNFDKHVYNSKVKVEGKEIFGSGTYTMLEELFRLFNKSVSQNYYIIESEPLNPIHYLWESFEKRKLVHTLLGLSAEFRHILLHKEWDVLLCVIENGALIDFFNKLPDDKKREYLNAFKNKHIFLICSYESIQQIYPGESKIDLIEKHKKHLQAYFSKISGEGEEPLLPNLTIMLLHFNLHNHHEIIFLKSIPKSKNDVLNSLKEKFTIIEKFKNDELSYRFLCVGSFYHYRRGSSHNIDPLFIGLTDKEITNSYILRDQQKLVDIYALYMARVFQFEYLSNEENEPLTETKWYTNSPFVKAMASMYLPKITEQISTDEFLSLLYAYISNEGDNNLVNLFNPVK